jgi:hypothetical protein
MYIVTVAFRSFRLPMLLSLQVPASNRHDAECAAIRLAERTAYGRVSHVVMSRLAA